MKISIYSKKNENIIEYEDILVNLGEARVDEVSEVVVSTNSTEQDSSQFSAIPFATKASFSYNNLLPDVNTIITSGTFFITSAQNVNLTIVQYPSNGSGTASILYTLRASEKGSVQVYGNYSSTSSTVTWSNVPAGTYYIGVENIGRVAVTGNGYVN